MYGITGQEMNNIRIQKEQIEILEAQIQNINCILQRKIDQIIDTFEVTQSDMANKYNRMEAQYNVLVDMIVRMNNLKENKDGHVG